MNKRSIESEPSVEIVDDEDVEGEDARADKPMSEAQAAEFLRLVEASAAGPERVDERVVDVEWSEISADAQIAVADLERAFDAEEDQLVRRVSVEKLGLIQSMAREFVKEMELDSPQGWFLFVMEWVPSVGFMYAVSGKEAYAVTDPKTGAVAMGMRDITMLERVLYFFGEFGGSGKGLVSLKRLFHRGIRKGTAMLLMESGKKAARILVRRSRSAAARVAKNALKPKNA